MPIRPATRSDIPAMAEIYAAAFRADPLFRFLFPYVDEHPEAFVQAARENLSVAWWDFGQILMVSYKASQGSPGQGQDERTALLASEAAKQDTESLTLTGFAQWERMGKGWEHLHGIWGWWDPRLLIKPTVSTFYRIRRYIWPNKAAARPTPEDPDPLTIWNFVPRILPFCGHFFSAPHRQVRWSLEVLGVHPDHQGKGYGRELVEDGLLRAKKDPEGDLPVCVVAADGKEAFYLKVGFNEIVGYTSKTVAEDGSDNPLRQNGIGGGAILWTK
ncbi:uncharacterized protein Z520_03613 [Fonsecaea multimorphosa CBS 102226]|uniref:N-acetyltransferase domain-containing protein n=1 Tax=Fonsecaea multimorphosa CBS 102226 TaxID=1442371 RepID=A0A0D2IV67_9EURO|nr:uncharacterized protein Z520_03613 [Fonsecaea multimorphosa CBS 102226]KIY00947.1 hypothetical protein Z520_03613 [Fonsecaea multimorphosa CBS 102226]OAL27532.1 hypothetical protein AYO22_03436 [Fonsecaea multimorphosa]